MTPARCARRFHEDECGFFISTLIKVALILGLVALSAIEAGAILFARFELQDTADRAAIAGADALAQRASCVQAATAIVDEEDPSIRIIAIECRPGGSVEVDIGTRANTLVVHRIPFFGIKDFARVRAIGEGRPPEF
ncbi:MAG: pilus assembly protein TadG-related protein [Actinomycetota bacterium]